MRSGRLLLEEAPPGIRVEFPGGAAELRLLPERSWTIGRFDNADVRVVAADPEALERLFQNGWGGRTNCELRHDAQGWCLSHLSHSGVILLNGVELWSGNGFARLADGDRIEPSAGLVFRFWETSERVI